MESLLGYFLATLNAILNAAVFALLISGFIAIHKKKIVIHRRLMLSAFGGSVLFLISYATRASLTGLHHFQGTAALRTVYLGILGSHTILAALTPILVITTMSLAIRGRIEKHRRLARITLPIWLYVALTGVVIYTMLYH